MSDKKLLSWFEKKREAKIVSQTQEHIAAVVLTVKEFQRAVDLLEKKDTKGALHSYERVFTYEHEADLIENAIYEELSKGELEPKDRYDLMRMVRQADQIANQMKSAARNLKITNNANMNINEAMMKHLVDMIGTSLKAVTSLNDAIMSLGVSDKDCKSHINKVEGFEKIGDKQYYNAKNDMFCTGLDSNTVIILHDLFRAVEQCTDYCKHTASMIDLLIVSGR